MAKWILDNCFDFEGREVRWGVKGQGKPVIIVHGTPWSSFNLRHLIYGLTQVDGKKGSGLVDEFNALIKKNS